MKYSSHLKSGLTLALALAWPGAYAQTEELILSTSLRDREPVPVVVLKRDAAYYIPLSQASALGLPGAKGEDVAGVEEPVIAGLLVEEVGEDSMRAQVPLSYFDTQLIDLMPAQHAAKLMTLPAVWLNYDIYYQPVPGLRPLGGTLSMSGGYAGWSLESLWQASRNMQESPLVRAATTLRTHEGNREWALGDVSIAQGLPMLSTRQSFGLQVRSQGRTRPKPTELALKGEAPASGVITVMANKQQLYRAVAQAGTYEVRGLPALPGEARYTVHFDDGQSVQLLSSLETSEALTLLPEDAFEYQATLGVPRAVQKGSAMAEYETTGLAEGGLTYGLSRNHNLSAQGYLSREESWAGGSLLSEWTPNLYSKAGAYLVRAPGNTGVLTTVSAHYGHTDFRLGASATRYSNQNGTPVDGFLGEARMFASLYGFNAYWIQNSQVSEGRKSQYDTYGLSKTYSFNRATLSLNASQTVREGRREAPFLAALLTWELSRGTALSATVSKNKVVTEATYFSRDWGGSLQATSGRVGNSAGASGFYATNAGTVFASVSGTAADSTLGLSGGAVLYQVDSKLRFQPTADQQGDSLLVVDAGAPAVEVVVESQRRFEAGPSGFVAIPFNSRVPQRVELDIKTLSADVSAEEVRHLVQTRPQEALLLKFDTRPMGFAAVLRLPNGEPVPEGSVVHLPEETTLVSGDGTVWLPRTAKKFRVQTARTTFCQVENVIAGADNVCR